MVWYSITKDSWNAFRRALHCLLMRLWMSFRCVYYIMPLYLVCVRARLFRMSFHYVAAGEKPLSNALTIQTVVGLFGSVPSGTIFAYI